VKLRPELLGEIQAGIAEKFGTGPKPLDLVFHGGSGSTPEEIATAVAISSGAVHVAESQRREVEAVLAETQRLDELRDVTGGRVQRVVGALVLDAVLFTAHDADLHLEDRVDRLDAREQLLRDLDVLVPPVTSRSSSRRWVSARTAATSRR
jgi:3-hydroxyacyl-CoA dehydrogenase